MAEILLNPFAAAEGPCSPCVCKSNASSASQGAISLLAHAEQFFLLPHFCSAALLSRGNHVLMVEAGLGFARVCREEAKWVWVWRS